MAKDKQKSASVGLYDGLKPADVQYMTKLDEKIALAQKQNKKEYAEFLLNKKQLDLNYIHIKKENKFGKTDSLPASLLSIINNRDTEKIFDNYKKDTKKLANQLFNPDMNLQQICAVACEFVRLTTSNFDRSESEAEQKPLSALCQSVSTNAYGLLSFYFGVSNEVDQTQLLAWMISLGLDIQHSISYAECVIDAYGKPVCHIVEFNGKLGVSYVDYVGVAKAYVRNIKKLTGLCEFLDFTEEIEFAKKRVLKVLSQYAPRKVLHMSGNIDSLVVNLAKTAVQNISEVTPSEYKLLSVFDHKIWKFSTLCELLFYSKQIEYEVILDLFNENQYTFKLKMGADNKVKVFPNKVIDYRYTLNDAKIYLVNKAQTVAPKNNDDELFAEQMESIGREAENAVDNLEPLPSDEVLQSLNVKFTPSEDEGMTFQDGAFKFRDDELNEMFTLNSVDFSHTSKVDLNKADEEQRMLEQATGYVEQSINAVNAENGKKKSFFDLLDEMSEKSKKNKARRLQEEYEKLERQNLLKTKEEIEEQKNNAVIKKKPQENQVIINKNNNVRGEKLHRVKNENPNTNYNAFEDDFYTTPRAKNVGYSVKNDSIPAKNSGVTLKNDTLSGKNDNFKDNNNTTNLDSVDNNVNAQKNNLAPKNNDKINNDKLINFDALESNEDNALVADDYIDDIEENNNLSANNNNDSEASILDSIMQFKNYNYYDNSKDMEWVQKSQNNDGASGAKNIPQSVGASDAKNNQKSTGASDIKKKPNSEGDSSGVSSKVNKIEKENQVKQNKDNAKAPTERAKAVQGANVGKSVKPQAQPTQGKPKGAPPKLPAKKVAPKLPKRKNDN